MVVPRQQSVNSAGAAAVVINGGATFSDLSNFKGGNLTISYVPSGAATDTLAVNNQGTGAGQIGVSGGTITYGGVTIGTIDATLGGLSGAGLKINFNAVSGANGDVLASAVQALLRQITFSTTAGAAAGSRAPPTPSGRRF